MKSTAFPLIVAICLLGNLAPRSQAQVPANDNFSGRLTLLGGGPLSTNVNNALATFQSPAEPLHANTPGGHSLWWIWQPPLDGSAVIDTVGSGIDTVLAVYTGKDLATLARETSNDDLAGNNIASRVVFNAIAENQYVIAVDGKGGATGAIRLNLRLVTTPEFVVQPVGTNVTEFEPAQFSAAALGHEPITYQWWHEGTPVAPDGTQRALSFPAARRSDEGRYRVEIRNRYGAKMSDWVRLGVLRPPKILEVTPVEQLRNVGGTAEFKVSAKGEEPLVYKWFRDGIQLSSQTAPSLVITNASTDDAGGYTVLVTNAAGSATNNSPVLLRINVQPPAISAPSDQTVLAGTPADFSVKTSGYQPIQLQWWKDDTVLLGQTNFALHIGGTTTNDAGLYWAVASNRYGTNSSGKARLLVELPPPNDHFTNRIDIGEAPAGVSQINKHATPEGLEPNHAGIPPVHSLWWSYRSPTNGLATIDPTAPLVRLAVYRGAELGTLSEVKRNSPADPRIAFATEPNVEYQIAVDDWTDQPPRTTGFRLSFTNGVPPPVIVGEPKSRINLRGGILEDFGGEGGGSTGQGGCEGHVFRVDAVSLVPQTYQWYFRNKPIPGQTNDTLVLTNAVVTMNGEYYAIVSNAGGETKSAEATLFVVAEPLFTLQPQSQTNRVCSTVTLSVGAESCSRAAYQWVFNGVPIPGETNKTLVIPSLTPALAGDYSALATNANGVGSSAVAHIGVDTRPVIAQQPGSSTISECDPFAFSVGMADQPCTTLHFQWRRDSVDLPGATNGILRFVQTRADDKGVYQVEIRNDWTNIVSDPATLTVNSTPRFDGPPADARIRVGESFTNRVSVTSCSSLSFRWRLNGTDLVPDARHLVDANGWLRVYSSTTNDAGSYQVVVSNSITGSTSAPYNVQVIVPPINDDFENRIHLAGTNVVTNGHNRLATGQTNEPAHLTGEPPQSSVWWTWTPQNPSTATIEVAGGGFSTRMAIYTGDALKSLSRVTDGTSRVTFPAAAGKTFQIAVDSRDRADGDIRLEINAVEIFAPPTIDERGQPQDIAVTNGVTDQFVVAASGSPDLIYQWYFNGVRINGATNSILPLKNVVPENEGNYTVTITNQFGEITSDIARLTFGSIIRGQVTDATTGLGIPGARVSVGNSFTNTNAQGNYTLLNVRPAEARADFDANRRRVRINDEVNFQNRSTLGSAVLRGQRDGYIDYENTQFEPILGLAVTNHFSMSPILSGMRLVLNWDRRPSDLDCFLSVPPIAGVPSQVLWYPEAAHGRSNSVPFAVLDRDAKSGYGPETITIHEFFPGTYRYYVQKYAQSAGDLTESKAIVNVYTSKGLLGSREVPKTGSGLFWYVCDIDGATHTVTWINQLVDQIPGATLPGPLVARVAVGGDAAHSSSHAKPQSPAPSTTEFVWTFGDGTSLTNSSPAKRYPKPGTYTVGLTMSYRNGTNTLVSAIEKPEFIVVYDEPPQVEILDPPPGRIFRAGAPIPVTAKANGIDDEISRVEFFAIIDGHTNKVGETTQVPYTIPYTNPPLQEGRYALTAKATDANGESTWATPVPFVIKDLSGEILILRNLNTPESNSEIDAMISHLEAFKWFYDPDAPVESPYRPPVVRILDQEDLYYDLINTFELIIWDDQGDATGGVTTNTVDLLTRAHTNGVPLYLIGRHLARAAEQLDEPWRSNWIQLTRLTASDGEIPCAPAELNLGEFQPGYHPILNAQFNRLRDFFGGEVLPFPCAGALEKAEVGVDCEVVMSVGGQAAMLTCPHPQDPDFGQPRRCIQDFLVSAGGDDPEGDEERRKLFGNAVSWLFRVAPCDNFLAELDCGLPPSAISVGDTVAFEVSTRSNNGRCPANGLVLTNQLPPGFEFISADVVSTTGRTNVAQMAVDGGVVRFQIGTLQVDESVRFTITARAVRGGCTTNTYQLKRVGRRLGPPCEQVFNVQGGCDTVPSLVAVRHEDGSPRLLVTGQAGCTYELQESNDLKTWTVHSTASLSESPTDWPGLPVGVGGGRYYRLRSINQATLCGGDSVPLPTGIRSRLLNH